MGRLRRSHRRRNGSRMDERHLRQRRGLQRLGRETQKAGRSNSQPAMMQKTMWSIGRAAALFLAAAFCALLAAQVLPLEPVHESGASVTGAFEGWFKNSDGSFNLVLGYF